VRSTVRERRLEEEEEEKQEEEEVMEEVMEEEVDNRLLEPRAERIARYKAERRRELAERFGAAGELPSKWGRREGDETDNGPAPVTGATAALNGRARYVANGYEEESATAGSAYLRR